MSKKECSVEPDYEMDGYFQVSATDGNEVVASGLTWHEAEELCKEMNE